MRKFEPEEIRRFLLAVDSRLTQPFDLVVIGGTAAALAYGVRRATLDIDTWTSDFRTIQPAIEAARKETGLHIPFQHAAVADAPWEFESRLETVSIPGLVHLAIYVPEKHDLVLMKALRGYEHDIETAAEIHGAHGLDLEILLERYLTEMDHVVGESKRLDMNILVVVERVFGAVRVKEAERRISLQRKRGQR